MGVKLGNKYHTISHMDDPLPGESPVRKTYLEKKQERDEQEKKVQDEIDFKMVPIMKEKKAREQKEKQIQIQK
jgi:hypothetical protein